MVLGIAIYAAGGFPAAAQKSAAEWFFDNYDHPVYGYAGATFGIADTDARLIRFTCKAGVLSVQGPLPDAWSKAGEAIGTPLRISFSLPEGQRQVIDGKIAEAGDGWNYVGEIVVDNPIIAALIAGKNVRVQRVDFRQVFEVPAQGATQPLRSLLQACADQKAKRP